MGSSANDSTLPNEYQFELGLDSGADLTILVFSGDDCRWHFKHDFLRRNEEHRVDTVNEQRLYVSYKDGVVDEVSLTMNVIFPAKAGKRFLYGVDLSPGYKTFVEFTYEKEGENFRMVRVTLGAGLKTPPLELEDQEGLVRQLQFPFPLKDVIEPGYGGYRVPFMANDGSEQYFAFPRSVFR